MAIPAAAGIAAGASAIGLYILQRAWGFVTGLLEAEAVEKLNEARADGPEAFDNVAGELAELERAVADYEYAFQTARLRAHALTEGSPHGVNARIAACNRYRLMPEMRQLQAAARKLRELDRHSEALAAETMMHMDTELQILQDEAEQHFEFWKKPDRREEGAARYGSRSVELADRRSEGYGRVYDRMAAEYEREVHAAVTRAADINGRISELIGRLEYLMETMRKDSDTFITLDNRICSKYRAKSK